MSFEQDVRTMLRERAEGVAVAPVVPERTMRRIRVRKALWAGGVLAAVAAVAVMSAVVLRSTVWTDAAPVPPAQERNQEIEPGLNGRILFAGDCDFWDEGTAPPRPGVAPYCLWDAFDQDTGSFLFVSRPDPRTVWVVGEDGPIAEFDCAGLGICDFVINHRGRIAFGPGPDPDVVTVPGDDQPQSAQIVDLNGGGASRRFSPPLAQWQQITDLAWSPDGSRLAIGTYAQPGYVCDDPCGPNVWISDRERPTWKLVYSERADDDWAGAEPTTIVDLAWSPDGRSLALLSAPDQLGSAVARGVWPRLVAIRLQPGQPAYSDTLHVYDDYDWGKKNPGVFVTDDVDLHFAFAWAPDGTRIAVTSKGGIAEISAEDGNVLAEHPGDGIYGPLAWLRER
jgi:WD40 repeat protein